jgi:hypothetical protein
VRRFDFESSFSQFYATCNQRTAYLLMTVAEAMTERPRGWKEALARLEELVRAGEWEDFAVTFFPTGCPS